MTSMRAALVGCLLALAVTGIFMALDKVYLHWYAEDTSARSTSLDSRIAALEAGLSANSSADNATSTGLTKIDIDFRSLRDAMVTKFHCIVGNPPSGGPSIVCP